MSCEETQKQLPLLLYGELSFDEEESVEQHLDGCEACRAELKRATTLQHAVDEAQLDVDPALLTECRRNLRIHAAALNSPRDGWYRGVRGFLALPAWFYKPVASVALVALGFFGARYLPVIEGASVLTRYSEPVASRVRYVEPNTSGQIQIVVEETRQRTLSGDIGDEPIRRLLLAAARDSSDPGLRVESMDILKCRVESMDVRRALIHALQHDPNPGVRLKALEGLRAAAAEPEIRKALSQALLADQNPGVRTQAIDLLTLKHEPAMVGVLQELMRKEDNNYVRMKCQKALHEMNASVEMF